MFLPVLYTELRYRSACCISTAYLPTIYALKASATIIPHEALHRFDPRLQRACREWAWLLSLRPDIERSEPPASLEPETTTQAELCGQTPSPPAAAPAGDPGRRLTSERVQTHKVALTARRGPRAQ